MLGRSHAASHAELEIGLRFPMSKKRGPVSPQDQEAIYRRLFPMKIVSYIEERLDIVQAYLSKRGNEKLHSCPRGIAEVAPDQAVGRPSFTVI